MLSRARKVQRREFETLCLGHLDALYRVAVRLTRNERDAEDLVQDSILRAFRFFHQFEPGSNAKAWLFKILTNTFINQYRKNKRERSGLAELLAEESTPALVGVADTRLERKDRWDPEALLLGKGLSTAVQRALEALPAPFRLAVLLADVEDFSYREIADILDCPIGTVMSRLYRGRGMLRVLLEEYAKEQGIGTGTGQSDPAGSPAIESGSTPNLKIVKAES